ncbi:thioredoxin fold domain-containing protein [Serratia fonticola]|uniref:thioredoxin fold domain-containing protein n=1 Tax=Serratia fonticola TaxID=47917 RepID=UPI0016496B20|nr:thioredoxin fold domain-containing protein [Serratia fonticola]MBC3252420.1 thioredoxin fold domain-containing protein [Serratia fonticola]
MSEHKACDTSIEINGQHLQVRLNGHSLFSLYRPSPDRYLLTLEQDNGQYTIWMRQPCNVFARLFSTDDPELANNIMNITADALQRMAMNEIPAPSLRRRGVVRLKYAGAIFAVAIFAVAWASWLSTLPHPPELTPQAAAELSSMIKSATNTRQLPPLLTPAPIEAPVNPSTAEITPPTQRSTLSPEDAAEARRMLATRLKNGAARKEFTVSLSSGHPRTLFVFADPECENCRIFEPTVQALSEQYNVEIFPVTLIGKARTAERVVPLLCSPAEKRAGMWRDLFDVGAGMLNPAKKAKSEPSACEAGQNALARNDLAFELYKLPGTPTVISDDGRLIPLQAMTSDTALQVFLNSAQ